MEIFINNAILHIINNDVGETHISNQELDIDSDVCYEFIVKHIKKLLNNPSTKDATFNEGSKTLEVVKSFISGESYFKDASQVLAETLGDIMINSVDIPPADIVIVQFETRLGRGKKGQDTLLDNEFLAILKLNHKDCFTHKANEDENGKDNQIVKFRNALPFDSGKVEEACLIPYEPMVIKLIEKPYSVNGSVTNYFSELFLECTTELSKKEVAEYIHEIASEINQKHFDDNIETLAKIKLALIDESIEEEGIVSMMGVASKAFSDNDEIRDEFVEMAKELGIKPDVELSEKFIRSQFGMQKFKASNGIEIKFPSELFDDDGTIEFINNEDGSVSITLKNLRKS